MGVAAIVSMAMIYPTYKRLCEDASLTIVLFCALPIFVMMFSGIRQVLAMSIGFIAYELTRNKKPLLFLATVILALVFLAAMIPSVYSLLQIRLLTHIIWGALQTLERFS